MQEWTVFFKEVGFPIAVAVLVLWRLDAHLIEMRNELRELRSYLGDRRRNLNTERERGPDRGDP